MLTARLEAPIGPHHRPVGPARFFKVVGDDLQADDGTLVANYRGGMWHADSNLYIAVAFDVPVLIRFNGTPDGQTCEFGPFERLRIVDGSMWVIDNKAGVLLAHFNGMTATWHAYLQPAISASEATIQPVANGSASQVAQP